MMVLDVLPWLFLVLFCVVFFVVCRWCCYMIATRGIYEFGSLRLLWLASVERVIVPHERTLPSVQQARERDTHIDNKKCSLCSYLALHIVGITFLDSFHRSGLVSVTLSLNGV
jgi:hypothetical protein